MSKETATYYLGSKRIAWVKKKSKKERSASAWLQKLIDRLMKEEKK